MKKAVWGQVTESYKLSPERLQKTMRQKLVTDAIKMTIAGNQMNQNGVFKPATYEICLEVKRLRKCKGAQKMTEQAYSIDVHLFSIWPASISASCSSKRMCFKHKWQLKSWLWGPAVVLSIHGSILYLTIYMRHTSTLIPGKSWKA